MKRKLNEDDVPQEVEISKAPPQQKSTSAADFTSLALDPRLIQAVKREKFSTPTAVQLKSIPLSLEGKDVLVRAKTGSGKTLAYLLPAIHGILHRKISSASVKRTSALILVPTKELANQVTAAIKTFTSFCAQDVRAENICRKEDDAVTKARLAENPDIVIATPSRASHWINEENLDMTGVAHLVIDEADVMLSYEYEEDLETIASSLPNSAQRTFTSATLREEVDTLTQLFFKDKTQPTVVDLSAEEAEEEPTLAQYTMKTAEQDKFLLIYTIFKLQLIKGKVIIFVADVDRCYRVKLFLEQFGIRSCVLNSELPVNSRLHVVEEFNRGVYDVIIAADENEVVGDESSRKKRKGAKPNHETVASEALVEVAEEGDDSKPPSSSINSTTRSKKPSSHRNSRSDREFGVSRGIDFRNVSCVLNFDLPTSAKSYTHRIGRTARAGRTGMALSFYIPREEYRKHKPTSIEQSKDDETVLAQIIARQKERGASLQEYTFDMAKVEGFRYRLADALRAVTRIAVREARTRELRQELIKSEKLRRHFEENPDDLRHLRHDTVSHAVRQQPHLKHVPDYLLPAGGSKAVVASEVGFVSARKNQENHLRRARAFNRARGKGRIAKTKGLDPLKSLNARGRGKK